MTARVVIVHGEAGPLLESALLAAGLALEDECAGRQVWSAPSGEEPERADGKGGVR